MKFDAINQNIFDAARIMQEHESRIKAAIQADPDTRKVLSNLADELHDLLASIIEQSAEVQNSL